MSTIRCIYGSLPPNFPATDQHPDAVRYHVGGIWVDAVGGAPTSDEIAAILNPAVGVLSLQQIACAKLTCDADNFDVSGVERSQGIVGAFYLDTDVIGVYFEAELPDTDYTVTPDTGVTKFTDRVEISRPGLTEVSFIVCRVQ